MNPTYDFTGQVALVTGASAGIGFATAQAFAQAGAQVLLVDNNTQTLQIATARLTAAGHGVTSFVGDVADETQVIAIVDYAVQTFGRLDMAFNNAGIVEGHPEILPTKQRRSSTG